MLLNLVDESWEKIVEYLVPVHFCALGATCSFACRGVDAANWSLFARRFYLTAPTAAERQAVRAQSAGAVAAAAWRARPDGTRADSAATAIFAAERGLISLLRAKTMSASPASAAEFLALADPYGITPLHAAAAAAQAETCTVLCAAAVYASRPCTSGTERQQQKQRQQQQLHLEHRAAVEALQRQTVRKRTVFHCAAQRGDLATIGALLRGAPREALDDLLVVPDKRSRPCALVALQEGHEAVCMRLVQAQGSYSTSNAAATPSTNSSSSSAVPSRRQAGVELLVHCCECDGLAQYAESQNIAAEVIRRGADVNGARLADGMLPIVAATVHGSLDMLQLLIEEPNIRVDGADQTGRTAVHWASQLGKTDMLELLLLHGADGRREASGGRTPLYIAAENGSVGAVDVLLRLCHLTPADALHETTRMTTPLSVAQRRGHFGVEDVLRAFLASFGVDAGSWAQVHAVTPRRATSTTRTPRNASPLPSGTGNTITSAASTIAASAAMQTPRRPLSAPRQRLPSPKPSAPSQSLPLRGGTIITDSVMTLPAAPSALEAPGVVSRPRSASGLPSVPLRLLQASPRRYRSPDARRALVEASPSPRRFRSPDCQRIAMGRLWRGESSKALPDRVRSTSSAARIAPLSAGASRACGSSRLPIACEHSIGVPPCGQKLPSHCASRRGASPTPRRPRLPRAPLTALNAEALGGA